MIHSCALHICQNSRESITPTVGLAGRHGQLKAKGARVKTRRRWQAREDFVLETVYWGTSTARLVPACSRAAPAGRCSSPTAARAGPYGSRASASRRLCSAISCMKSRSGKSLSRRRRGPATRERRMASM